MASIKKLRRQREVARDFTVQFFKDDFSESEWHSAFKSEWDWIVTPHMSSSARHSVVLANLLRTYTSPHNATIDAIRSTLGHGFDKKAFTRLKHVLNTSGEELSRVVRISDRTIARREVFEPDESERILRVASAFHRAIEVLGSLEKARRWFSSPKRALGNKTPMEFCDTDLGAEEVTNLLGRIEHGVFS